MGKVKVVKSLKAKGYPTSSKRYIAAHIKADKDEKRKFPKGYEKLKRAEMSMGKRELMGKHTKSGKVEVERKFAKRYGKEIAYHERQETKYMNKRKRSKKHAASKR
jgi:hypothetical protein